MRDHYEFSKAKPNPFAKRLKTQVVLRLDRRTIGYFKALAEEMGIPYQTVINLYLRDTVRQEGSDSRFCGSPQRDGGMLAQEMEVGAKERAPM